MNEQEFKKIVASNLVFYRNLSAMTQAQVAEALNYSDKSVSKWERGEGMPDLFVLYQIAKLYRVGVSDLLNTTKKRRTPFERKSKLLVSLLSVGVVWLITVVVFVVLSLATDIERMWLAFVYAVPVSSLVMLVFSAIWAKRIWTGIAASIMIWSIAIAVYLTFFVAVNKIWLIFLISITLQILTILWFFLRDSLHKMKRITSDITEENR